MCAIGIHQQIDVPAGMTSIKRQFCTQSSLPNTVATFLPWILTAGYCKCALGRPNPDAIFGLMCQLPSQVRRFFPLIIARDVIHNHPLRAKILSQDRGPPVHLQRVPHKSHDKIDLAVCGQTASAPMSADRRGLLPAHFFHRRQTGIVV